MYTDNNRDLTIFSYNIDGATINQMYTAMEPDWAVKGALMPDAHLGYGLPIGGVLATEGHIVPSFVGYDIGCGVAAVKTPFVYEDVKENAQAIYDNIVGTVPLGFNVWNAPVTDSVCDLIDLDCTSVAKDILANKRADRALGTLGGGNHFIEIGYDLTFSVWIIVHSGSRGPGHGLATHYMRLAGGGKVREGVWPLRLDTSEGMNYSVDLDFMLGYALKNRQLIWETVFACINGSLGSDEKIPSDFINRNHNHAEFKDDVWIHRKGATHAEEGMLGVVPGNMRDGSFIVRGKGNQDSLYSSSHGAGRVLSRKQAKLTLDYQEFVDSMNGIACSTDQRLLDEAPDAYKDIFQVMDEQRSLVDIVTHVKPIINVKA